MMCLENGLPNYGNRIGRGGKKREKEKEKFFAKAKRENFFFWAVTLLF